MDIDLLWFCKDTGCFEFIKLVLQFLKGVPVVPRESAFALCFAYDTCTP